MKMTFLKLTTLSALTLTLAACAQGGFNAGSVAGATSNNAAGVGNGNGSSSVSTPTASPLDQVDMNGYFSGGTYGNTLAVSMDKVNKALILSVPLPLPILVNLTYNIPQISGSTIQTVSSGMGENLEISIPLTAVVKGVNFPSNVTTLPSGQPLPLFPSGAPSGFALQLPGVSSSSVYLYVGVGAAAIFVETPSISLPIGFLYPVKNQSAQEEIGAFSYVPKFGTSSAGFYLAAKFPLEVVQFLNQNTNW